MRTPRFSISLAIPGFCKYQDARRACFVTDALKERSESFGAFAVDDDKFAGRVRDAVRYDF